MARYYILTDVKNDDEATTAIKGLLGALAAKFDNEFIKIDTSVYNASRIRTPYYCWTDK
jgi:hypothetical protein